MNTFTTSNSNNQSTVCNAIRLINQQQGYLTLIIDYKYQSNSHVKCLWMFLLLSCNVVSEVEYNNKNNTHQKCIWMFKLLSTVIEVGFNNSMRILNINQRFWMFLQYNIRSGIKIIKKTTTSKVKYQTTIDANVHKMSLSVHVLNRNIRSRISHVITTKILNVNQCYWMFELLSVTSELTCYLLHFTSCCIMSEVI